VSERTTERLLHELTEDLAPVRPIPRLRAGAAAVFGVWAGAVLLAWFLGVVPRDAFEAIRSSSPSYLIVFAGLALMAVGATLAAMAGAVPGREEATRGSGLLACAGVGLAAGGGLWAVVAAGADNSAAGAIMCLSEAGTLAFLPVLVASLFLARGVAHRPRLGAGLAVCGSVALGALVIHASCRIGGGLHVLLGHALAPLFLGFGLAIPLAALVRHWGRRERSIAP